jgi:hypothetical protein
MMLLVKGGHVRHVTQVMVCSQVQQPIIIQMVVVVIMMCQVGQHVQLSSCHSACAAPAAATRHARVALEAAALAPSSSTRCDLRSAADGGPAAAAADASRAPHCCHGCGRRPTVCCG